MAGWDPTDRVAEAETWRQRLRATRRFWWAVIAIWAAVFGALSMHLVAVR